MIERSVKDTRIEVESPFVNIRITRDVSELFFSGNTIGPLKEGYEMELPRWMASELAKYRVAKILNDKPLDTSMLAKIHWRECIPSSRELPPLDHDFYYKLRLLIKELDEQGVSDQSKRVDRERVLTQAKDIITCRIRKILNLAATPMSPEVPLQNMAAEERILYSKLSHVIDEWRKAILTLEGDE
ncbi:MAG: hypothetical protein ACUVTM_01525 [Candidatus Bathyarchaeia archaeon]